MTLAFEGHAADFNLDSAASGSLSMGYDVVQRFGLFDDRGTRPVSTQGMGGSIAASQGTVRWLEIGGRRIEEVPALFAVVDSGAMAHPWPDGLVGAGLMDDFLLVMDLSGRRIAFLDR